MLRFSIVGLAVLIGSFSETGLFITKSGKKTISKRFEGCKGAGLYDNETCRAICLAQANTTAWEPLPPSILQPTQSCHWCKEWSGGDTLFDHILAMHDGLPLASVLDAGTGPSSIQWMIQSLRPKKWTAVTASEQVSKDLQTSKILKSMREGDAFHIGNWQNASFKVGKKFDLVLA